MPEQNDNRPKPLFTRTLRPGGKIYFLDVYKGRQGSPYLSICENRKDKEGNFTRIRMFVSPEGIPELRDALDEVAEFLRGYRDTDPAAQAAPAEPAGA